MQEHPCACCEGGCTLGKLALGLSIGTIWSISVLLVGLMATYTAWETPLIALIGSMYVGFDATLVGSFIGAGWALLDGFVGGFLVALVYNLALRLSR